MTDIEGETFTMKMEEEDVKVFTDELAPIQGTQVHPYVGVSAMALNMALKYCGINTVHDGTLYQQYKLEGKNLQGLSIGMVLHIAKQFEEHLVGAPGRIHDMLAKEFTEIVMENWKAEEDELGDPPTSSEGQPS